MYEKLYNLSAAPFESDPDNLFLYEHRRFVQAQTYMSYAFMVAEGFAMVTGRPAVGKTTLITRLVGRFRDQGVKTVNLDSAQLRGRNLLRVVAENFGIQRPGKKKEELMQQLGKQLRQWHSQGTRSLLVVDEAQDLSKPDFEDLLRLVNLLEAERPLLQIFLVGKPELRDLMSTASMEQVRRRIVAETELEALEEDELQPYILHRLEVAAWQEDPTLDEGIYPLVYQFSEGVPGRVNLVCSRLLERACAEDKHEISVTDAQGAIESLKSEGATGEAVVSGADSDLPPERESGSLPAAAAVGVSEVEPSDFEEVLDFTGFSASPVDTTDAVDENAGQDWGVHVHSADEVQHHSARSTASRAARVKRRKGGSGWYLGVLALLLLLWIAWLRGYIDTASLGPFQNWLTETSDSLKGETVQSPTQAEPDRGAGSQDSADTLSAADAVTASVQVADTTPGSSATTELETGSASEAVSFPEPAARLQASGEIPTGDGAAPQASTLAANRAATTDGIDCSIKFRISFDNDSSRLSEAAREQLDAVVSDCLDTGSNKVRVTGYTDTWGGWDYNLRLSRQRAEAAAAYLIEQGVNPESVYAEGLGEYGMDQAAAGPEANADDRRIVLVEIMPVESPP